ncbi:hypothetical protein [Aquabacterium sp. OR-4]|uniref:hypothetical protein n=1 Tax=Aquabacterium sp. OR-4 TaxID=2978127 RepID=UPI0028C6F9D7|nr:hypothetical protein [Aquabacterium sp. OR-4]MDT7837653.1 hypothetical protein [Aquabacterium sp. OR-4]
MTASGLPALLPRVARALRQRCVQWLRRSPRWQAWERRRLAWLAAGMHSAQVQARPAGLAAPLLDMALLRQAFEAEGDYHVVDLDALQPHDAAALAAAGIDLAVLRGQRSDRRLKAAGAGSGLLPPQIFDAGYQRDALQAGALAFDSPCSGRPLRSAHSLLAASGASVFYRFTEGERVFYLAVGRESLGYQPVYWYFPAQQLVALLGSRDWAWLGRWELDQLRAFMLQHRADVARYLQPAAAPHARVALVDHHHFAHHLWNSLSGVQALLGRASGGADGADGANEAGGPIRANNPAAPAFERLAATAEPLGPIEEIFPELAPGAVLHLSAADLPLRAVREGWFIVRAGGLVVNDDLVSRLRRVALAHCSDTARQQLAGLRAASGPRVWFTIRTGTRTWASQAQGIAELASALHQQQPGMALVIDGLAVPWLRRPTDKFSWLDGMRAAELQLVAEIRARLPAGLPVTVLAGASIFDGVALSEAADVYVATHGTLQNKLGWLANCPGVVHGSSLVLRGISGPIGQYCAFWSRAGGVAPRYLQPDQVHDIEQVTGANTRRWAQTLNHYEVDGPALRQAVAEVLAQRQPAA